MKNRIPGIFSLLILLMLLFSCSRAQKEDAGMADRRIIIGFSIATDTFILERWNKDIKIFTGAAKELGAEVLFQLSAESLPARTGAVSLSFLSNL